MKHSLRSRAEKSETPVVLLDDDRMRKIIHRSRRFDGGLPMNLFFRVARRAGFEHPGGTLRQWEDHGVAEIKNGKVVFPAPVM